MLALVVDDSTAMRRILRRTLAPLGFDVYEAENGRVALELLADCPTLPDIACVDWNMPEMNGLEFVRTVRKNPDYRTMAMMMVTTESEQSQIVRALAAGAHEYCIKPFTADAIRDKLTYLGLVPAAV
jgi:two-component system chemotaxis response regulator CheY